MNETTTPGDDAPPAPPTRPNGAPTRTDPATPAAPRAPASADEHQPDGTEPHDGRPTSGAEPAPTAASGDRVPDAAAPGGTVSATERQARGTQPSDEHPPTVTEPTVTVTPDATGPDSDARGDIGPVDDRRPDATERPDERRFTGVHPADAAAPGDRAPAAPTPAGERTIGDLEPSDAAGAGPDEPRPRGTSVERQTGEDRPSAVEQSPSRRTASAGGGTSEAFGRWRAAGLVVGVVAVAGGIPLAVALGVLHQPRWFPALDLAQTELRVRDVGTGDPPLLGLTGRFFGFGHRGSHPGPLSFWALWPVYTLLGGTAWALQAATAALNLVAMATATWIGHRRGGTRLALLVALAVAVLAHAYTAERLTSPWNPFLPVLWWMVFLLAVWSVLCDDLPMLPVAVFAGSFCAQTHIPYLGLVAGLGILVTLAVGWRWLSATRAGGRPSPDRDRDPGGPRMAGGRRGARRRLLWGGATLGVLLALWLPPLIEQLTSDLGNFGLLREHFTHPVEDAVGLGSGLEAWLAHLDVRALWRIDGARTISNAPSGSPVPGLLLLAAWATTAVVACRRRRQHPDLWRFHLTVGATALLELVAISRVLGRLWDYLVLWAWGTTVLMVVATLLTAPLLTRRRLGLDHAVATPARPTAATGTPAHPPATHSAAPVPLTARPAAPPPHLSTPATATATATSTPDAAPGGAPASTTATATPRRPATRVQTGILVAALVVVTAAFTADATRTRPLNGPESETLARIAPTVTAALEEGRLVRGTPVPGGGADGRYLVRWHENELATPGVGFGLLLELERQGLDVGGPAADGSAIVPHRVRHLHEATATVNVVVGDAAVSRWRSTAGAVEVAHADLRTPEQRARFESLRDEIVAGLQEAGLDDLAATLQVNVLAAAFDDRMPPDLEDKADDMLEIGAPTVVFVAPRQAG